MKRILFAAAMAAALALVSCGPKGKTPPPMETPKDALVAQLFELTASGRIAYGHQDDLVYGHNWVVTDVENDPLERSDVKAVCGKYPMVVGFDLGGIELGSEANLDGVPFDLMRRAAQTHIARGGIVTFSWHPRNPLTGGDAWDISSDEVVRAVLEGGACHDQFIGWLRRGADFIESLGDVAVIFRPWHENVGSWFWWGGRLCTPEQYQELYRMTWRYFTLERGLGNILWCYSPNGNSTPKEYMERYPGDEFVDILGFDTYEYGAAEDGIGEAGARYVAELKDNLVKLNVYATEHQKLQCLSETGMEGLADPSWWTETLLPAIQDYPICYLLTWRNAHDKPEHFYAPWEGFENAGDFKAFAGNPKIKMLD